MVRCYKLYGTLRINIFKNKGKKIVQENNILVTRSIGLQHFNVVMVLHLVETPMEMMLLS